MWDLHTIKRINQKAVQLAASEEPERDALFLSTGIKDFPRPILANVKDQEIRFERVLAKS